METTYFPTPTEIRSIACPFCEAAPEQFCIGVREKKRKANHQERLRAWLTDRNTSRA